MRFVERGQRQKAQDINQVVEALKPLLNLSVGPGLELRKTPSGVQVHLAARGPSSPARAGAVSQGNPANPSVLGWQQGVRDTDTWTRTETGPGVQVRVVTDIQFNSSDPDNLTLTMRSRTLHFDSAGCLYAISAEDEQQTVITTAVLCQESP